MQIYTHQAYAARLLSFNFTGGTCGLSQQLLPNGMFRNCSESILAHLRGTRVPTLYARRKSMGVISKTDPAYYSEYYLSGHQHINMIIQARDMRQNAICDDKWQYITAPSQRWATMGMGDNTQSVYDVSTMEMGREGLKQGPLC